MGLDVSSFGCLYFWGKDNYFMSYVYTQSCIVENNVDYTFNSEKKIKKKFNLASIFYQDT
jgi:hypothetical protein